MRSLQKQIVFGQKKAVKKLGNSEENLIHCSVPISDGRVEKNSALKRKIMDMETLAVTGIIGYVFAILGLVAFVRLVKLTKTLK